MTTLTVLLVVLVSIHLTYGFKIPKYRARSTARGDSALSVIGQVGKVVELEVPMDGENVKPLL